MFDLFDLLSEKGDYLVNYIPFLYWIYLLGNNFESKYFVIAIVYAVLIIINILVRENILDKVKSKQKLNTRGFAEYFLKKHPWMTLAAFVHLFLGIFSFIVMIFEKNKDFVIWTILFAYGMALCYSIIKLQVKHKNKLKQVIKEACKLTKNR